MRNVLSNAFHVVFSSPKFGHDSLIEGFVYSIINNKPPPVTPEEGRATVRIMEKLVDHVRDARLCE